MVGVGGGGTIFLGADEDTCDGLSEWEEKGEG